MENPKRDSPAFACAWEPCEPAAPIHALLCNSFPLQGFTIFPTPKAVEIALSSSESVMKLVEKPVQIPVRLALLRDLAD